MKKNKQKFLTDYRNKIQTRRVTVRMPMELVDFIGSEMQKRESNSFSSTLLDLIKYAKENIENDN